MTVVWYTLAGSRNACLLHPYCYSVGWWASLVPLHLTNRKVCLEMTSVQKSKRYLCSELALEKPVVIPIQCDFQEDGERGT